MALSYPQPEPPLDPPSQAQAPCSRRLAEAGAATRELTLLVAEDNPVSRNMLLFRIGSHFKRVIEAVDGLEALTLFREHRPDLVLTDQMMPRLSGLQFMEAIRSEGAQTPVILMTSVDDQVLLEAINKGVERFVPKPFDFAQLIRTLEAVAVEVVNQRLVERHREQEVELLRYRDAYNALQQESARRKERHVVRHDLKHRVLPGAQGVRWAINVAYTPHDIMCGDGYSVRRLFDGRQLIFLVDAMGSGMSASLTAMLTTSFFNYQVDHLHLWRSFTLEGLLERFQEYLSSVLLEEEVLSCGFLLVDLEREEIQTALFALPPVLLRMLDGTVKRVPGGNPPLASYPTPVRLGSISLANVANLLVMTDGVTDALLRKGGSYREVLEQDFRAAPTLKAVLQDFEAATLGDSLDDLTVLHLRRLDFPPQWSWRGAPELSLDGLGRLIGEFLRALSAETSLPEAALDEVELILTEALTNAFEHGCLAIDRQEKLELLTAGEFEAALASRVMQPGASITLSATLWRGAQKPLLLLEVQDSGPGLPPEAIGAAIAPASLNGRGLKMIARHCDSLFSGGPNGHLIIFKTLYQGDGDAD